MGRFSRWPVEWLHAVAILGVGFWVLVERAPKLLPVQVQIYRNLASAFVTGWVLIFVLSYGDQLLRPLPESRRWRWGALGVAMLFALGLFVSIRSVNALPVVRLLESFALCAVVGAAVLTLFLPVSGLLGGRAIGRAIVNSVRQWGPLMAYLLVSGVCLAAVTQGTPLLWDPVLLRMDVSLGFSPSEALFHWGRERPWVGRLGSWGYPLLGFFIAAVAGRIYGAGAMAQARRAIFAILLVGTLGITCYALVPAIAARYAFPELFQTPGPFQRAMADMVRETALTGPRQIPADWTYSRDCMPSLHAAFSLVALAAAWNWRRRFFWLCLPLGLVQIITAMTYGKHYLVDVFAAVPFATFCWWLADLGVRHTGMGAERLPSPDQPRQEWWRGAGIFLGSLGISLGLFLWWTHAAPIPPALAWPLAVIATFLPVIAFPRTRTADGSPPHRPSRLPSLIDRSTDDHLRAVNLGAPRLKDDPQRPVAAE